MAFPASSRVACAPSTLTYPQTVLFHVAAVQQVPQGEEGGGLAGLPRRVQNEVALVLYEAQDVIEIQMDQRRDAVVFPRGRGLWC